MVGKLKKTISFLLVCMILFMFSGCGTSKEYRVLCDEGVIAEKEYYRQGDEVTLVVYRDKGGEIELFADGGRIDPSDDSDAEMNIYRFSMPDHDVRIELEVFKQSVECYDLTAWTTAFANWSDDSSIAERSLNSELVLADRRIHLPVFRIDSVSDLGEFRDAFDGILTLDKGVDEIGSFDDAVAGTDEEFFEENSLIIIYVPASSGSFRYEIAGFSTEGGAMYALVRETERPEVYNSMMSGWFMIGRVSDSRLKDCVSYDAELMGEGPKEITQLPGHIVYGSFSWKETQRAVAEMDDESRKRVRTEGFVNTGSIEMGLPFERAKAEATIEYDLSQVYRDEEEDVWMVRLFSSRVPSDVEEVYMTGDGVTLLIIYGEQVLYGNQ